MSACEGMFTDVNVGVALPNSAITFIPIHDCPDRVRFVRGCNNNYLRLNIHNITELMMDYNATDGDVAAKVLSIQK